VLIDVTTSEGYYHETSLTARGFPNVNEDARRGRAWTTFADLVQSMAAAIVAAARGVIERIGQNVGSAWVRGLPPEQLRRVLTSARTGNARMLGGVIDFQHKRAHDVMRPRTEIVALSIDATEEEVRTVLKTERYSRYPVYRESLDDVVGIFIAKDLWSLESDAAFDLESLTREAVYVPASVPAERVLNDLRRRRAHLAVVLDEYGGTAGIVTMEDLIEQVIGDIADEDEPAVRRSFEFEGVLELAGNLSLIDVRSEHHLDIPDGEWTTIGGYAFAKLGRLPKLGDRVPFPDGQLEVIAIEGRRVAALRVLRAAHVSSRV
jgi:CBS domain containing-hemolysin-like protein